MYTMSLCQNEGMDYSIRQMAVLGSCIVFAIFSVLSIILYLTGVIRFKEGHCLIFFSNMITPFYVHIITL